jgi:metallo-beta-lactamase family protein
MDFPHIFHHGAVSGVTGLFQGTETSPEGKAGAGRLAIDFPLDGINELEDIIHRKNTANQRPRLLGETTAGVQGVGRSMMPESRVGGGVHKQPQLDWSNLPIILDSPLASRFTQVYRELDHFWDTEVLSRLKSGRNPLAFRNLITVDDHRSRLAMVNRLTQTAQPAIVIAGNGMCSSGRIVNCLKAMLGDERHDVLFVGYQAEGITGRQMLRFAHKGGYVEMDEKRYAIRAQVHTIGGYSAHADQKGLLRFVTSMRQWPSQVRIVHDGVPEAKG